MTFWFNCTPAGQAVLLLDQAKQWLLYTEYASGTNAWCEIHGLQGQELPASYVW